MLRVTFVHSSLFALVLCACGGGESTSPPPSTAASTTASTTAEGAAPQTFAEQAAHGKSLYEAQCSGCHGAAGQGGRAPAVVGLSNGALPLDPSPSAKYRKTQFKTVSDVADFVVKTMPPKAPGSLSPDAYWSILAFDLQANGITLDQKLTPDLAKTLEIPRK